MSKPPAAEASGANAIVAENAAAAAAGANSGPMSGIAAVEANAAEPAIAAFDVTVETPSVVWIAFLNSIAESCCAIQFSITLPTCARPTAILQLTWPQIDFDHGLIDLNPRGRTQTAKRRPTVPIADYALEPLKSAYAARQSDHIIERGGKGIANIKKAFSAASERSNVHATPYTLRHTGAVWRAEDGVPMSELAQLMGHEDSATTEKHYARYSPTYLRKAANAGTW
jgi:integrase